ncbi:MAG: tRNA (N6-isopentenyl adenosine(37)-C2)-methylthiotransferase MiaB [Sedimentisphaerales bacterium]|nr:tRNA (N6-isopentenyl adenosine(37)-C2)-methylthiotransferase MiaB [Sedimentisphaerales bacterium]
MNKLDSSLVTSALKGKGYLITDKAVEADIVLINTCSVRGHAEERVYSHLGHLKHLKKNKTGLIVGVIGCMAQRLGTELLEHEAVDIVAGPAQIAQIPELIRKTLLNKSKSISITEKIRTAKTKELNKELDNFEFTYDSDENHIHNQAFVRVMRGCNKFCSYCIVPLVRGPEVSRSPQAIMEQINKLSDSGVKQVTLLGQTINSYTYTESNKTYRLADLLEMASKIDGIKWIRFITSHPKNFDESILKAMAGLPKVCKYLHVPAQSGSDRILKAMNRGYTADEYLKLIEKAKQIVPNIAIASDFIVGFPDESDKDFQATVKLVKKAKYKNCFVFKYSPRPGTLTDKKLQDNIPEEIKKLRNMELLEVQNQISSEDNKKFLGRIVEVLVEGPSKKPHLNKAENKNNPQLIGRTATDHIVVFNGSESIAGEFAEVMITNTSALTLFGALNS